MLQLFRLEKAPDNQFTKLWDRVQVHKFHHIDWWCADATSTHKRCVVSTYLTACCILINASSACT